MNDPSALSVSQVAIHPDLRKVGDELARHRMLMLLWLGVGVVAMGFLIPHQEIPTLPWVSSLGSAPFLFFAGMNYYWDRNWRRIASSVFASETPVTETVTSRQIALSEGPSYHLLSFAQPENNAPEIVRVAHITGVDRTLPPSMTARVYRNPKTREAVVVENDLGHRLWCQRQATAVNGAWDQCRWIPHALTAYFVAAGIVLFVVASYDDAATRKTMSWPTTAGKVVESHFESVTDSTPPVRCYSCQYQYTLGGKTYQSDRTSYCFRTSYFPRQPGDKIIVHYNPQKPEQSVLESRSNSYTYGWVGGMFVIAAFAFVVSHASDFRKTY